MVMIVVTNKMFVAGLVHVYVVADYAVDVYPLSYRIFLQNPCVADVVHAMEIICSITALVYFTQYHIFLALRYYFVTYIICI